MRVTSAGFLCALFSVDLATAFTNPRHSEFGIASSSSTKRGFPLYQYSYVNSEIIEVGEPFPLVEQLFPGAIPYSQMLNSLASNLVSRGYHIPTTICATSLCGDELNRPLERALSKMFAENYQLGGVAGCPFGGLTAFQKMKMHVPDGGSCVIVHGTHVGVSSQGQVGTVERVKCEDGDKCCFAAIVAADYVLGVLNGQPEAPPPTDPCDASQYFVGTMLMPHAERLKQSANPMIELPYALYDAQKELMYRIIKEGSQYGQFPGTVAVLGGIQINTPPGKADYFVPLNFNFYNGLGELQESLIDDTRQTGMDWTWG